MSIEEHIDRFLLLISDPRNIAPDEFAAYYPKIGGKYNPKNLDKGAVEKHFERLQKFKVSEDWNGYISLKAESYLLLKSFEEQSIKSKEAALHYYVLRAKNLNMKTQSFATEQQLSKAEYYNLLGAYTVFCNNLNTLIIKDFKALMAEHGDNVVDTSKHKKRGRKATEIKDAKDYLQNFYSEEHKTRFLQELKIKYQKSPHVIFNHVIRALKDRGYLEIATNIEIKEAFEKALDREGQSQQNYNNQSDSALNSGKEYDEIKKNILLIFEGSATK